MLADAPAERAQDPDRVGFVHDEKRPVALDHGNELGQVGDVTLHAVDALERH